MLSPKRHTLMWEDSISPTAVTIHCAIFLTTSGFCQCPTTILRSMPMRLTIWPYSRSPCADWFSFMKSISIVSYGISSLNCVWKCISGFLYSCSPRIQDFAGENVCIHVMTPAHSSSAFASLKVFLITAFVISVGFHTTSYGSRPDLLSPSTMILECSATFFKHASPYRSCEPVANQNL